MVHPCSELAETWVHGLVDLDVWRKMKKQLVFFFGILACLMVSALSSFLAAYVHHELRQCWWAETAEWWLFGTTWIGIVAAMMMMIFVDSVFLSKEPK